MKEVESVRCPHVNMNPITWQQVEQTTKMSVLREATITAPTAKVQVIKMSVITSLLMMILLVTSGKCKSGDL